MSCELTKWHTYINNACDMALNWRASQEKVDLIVIIPIPPEILDTTQACLPIRHSGIHVVLLSMLVDRESFEVYVTSWSELRFHWAGYIDGTLHAKFFHAILHHSEFNRYDSGHLDRTTKRNLTITLRKVQIAYAEFGAFDMDREVHFAPATQVLDITVASMFRATGYSAGPFSTNLLFYVLPAATDVNALWVGRKCYCSR